MRKLVVLLTALAGLGCANILTAADDSALLFTSFRKNGEDGLHLMHSRDGYTWTALKNDQSFLAPKVGGKLMRDPQIVAGPDGTYHMVWTTGWTRHGAGYANSKDLITWSEQQLLPVMAHEPQCRNVWAPELFYDEARKQFLIFWSSTIPGRFPETEKVGDDGYNHRLYYTATKDFAAFSPTKLFYDPGFNCIDATLVQEGGKTIMILKDETRNPPKKNLRLAMADRPEGPYGPAGEPFTGKFWAEGPTAIKLGDTWMVYFDRYTEHRYGVATSKDLKTWTDESDKVKFPKDHRHGSVLRVPKKILDGLLAQ
jgi:beta-xylosidase